MADRLRDGGFGVILVDYLTAEKVANTCGNDTLPERCDAILQRLPDGAHAQVRRYAGARHGFDLTEGPEVLPVGGGMTVGRNPTAGEEAWEEIFAFLGRN